MSSPVKMKPAQSDTYTQSKPVITQDQAEFTLNDHIVDGVGRGSLSDLSFRPNATFHPVREVIADGKRCVITFDKPLQTFNGSLSKTEVLILLKNFRAGVRETALGQQLYLYPGVEAFGMGASGDLCFALINVRPRYALAEYSTQKMSVIAFFELMQAYSPQGWKVVRDQTDKINTLAALESALEGISLWRRIIKLTRILVAVFLVLSCVVVGLAFLGPPEIKEPIRARLYPWLSALSEALAPELEERQKAGVETEQLDDDQEERGAVQQDKIVAPEGNHSDPALPVRE